jgi:hypothetical protein
MSSFQQDDTFASRWRRPQAVMDAVSGITAATLRRRGFVRPEIVLRWAEIAGAVIAAQARPQKIVFPTGKRNDGILHLATTSAGAAELQYYKAQILERVNACFGYAAVVDLRLNHVATLPKAVQSTTLLQS